MIDNLKVESASGPDGIPPRVIKELKNEIVKPLTILFQKSMETGKIPDEWRKAEVTPIFKKGKKSDPGNYRPVSLTCVIGKMMERLVKEAMTDHIETNGLISDEQHGFRAGRSAQTNLIEFTNETTKWLDEGKAFDILYLDFAKAFDKVHHEKLVKKLEMVGIDGKLKEWLTDWLRGRKQRVRVENAFSDWVDVLSSVVQGSVLGGILFDIFIDDIGKAVMDALIRMFADDTKIALKIEKEEDGRKMQQIIDNVAAWAVSWGMTFNTKKCKIIHAGLRNPKKEYTMNGMIIAEATEEKDLGVLIDASLKPGRQCAAAANAANFALGQVQRAFHYRCKRNMIPLYKSFIRPKLEFSAAAWNPWLESDKKVLERVQERMIRMLSDAHGNTYEEKLEDAGLTNLTERRERGDAIETYKTLNGFNRVKKSNWFQIENDESRPTRNNTTVVEQGAKRRSNVLKVEKARLEVRRNAYNVRAAVAWNQIPDEVREMKSVNGFKNAYDGWRKNTNNTTV